MGKEPHFQTKVTLSHSADEYPQLDPDVCVNLSFLPTSLALDSFHLGLYFQVIEKLLGVDERWGK